MKRRNFLISASGIVGGSMLSASQSDAAETADEEKLLTPTDKLLRRGLGKSGDQVSIVGFPCNGFRHIDQTEANETIAWALAEGVNYFDVAPAYGRDGECEIKLGVGLQNVERDSIFLSCKTKMRDKAGAREELERSLERLKTDYFDLYQLHCLQTTADVEQAMARGGAMEALLEARKQGKIKHIGFSAHTSIAALAAMRAYRFDTAMFPINFIEHFNFAFGQAVLELANNQGVSVIGIKATSGGDWPEGTPRSERYWWYRVLQEKSQVDLAVRFALSQKNVMATIPASFMDNFKKTVEVAQKYRPITPDEMKQLHELARESESVFLRRQKQGLIGLNEPITNDDERGLC